MSLFLLATFYVSMALAGIVVEVLFQAFGLVPDERNAKVLEASVTWNYTTILNILFLALAAVLLMRFLRTGGPDMLKMMSHPIGTSESRGAIAMDPQEGVYACPMHPEERGGPDDRCPKCGMKFEPLEDSSKN